MSGWAQRSFFVSVLGLGLAASASGGTLVVETQPPGATVELDGATIGVTPVRASVLAGPHSLAVRLSDHEPFVFDFAMPAERDLSLPIVTLRPIPRAPARATIRLRTQPPGAQLTLDGVNLGAAPTAARLRAGTHRIDAALAGASPRSVTFEVAPGKDATIDVTLGPLEPPRALLAPLAIATTPAGATVLVDDVEVGRSPFRGAVAVGAHVVTARLAGYESAHATVTAVVARQTSASLALVPIAVAFEVQSTPPGARLSVDDELAGVTPFKAAMSPERHVLTLALAGWVELRAVVDVAPGVSFAQSFTLERATPPGRRWGYAVAALGAAVELGAAYFAYDGTRENAAIKDGSLPDGAAMIRARDAGKADNAAGYAMLGAGVLALGAGAALVAFSPAAGDLP